jgi:hypothetical protein
MARLARTRSKRSGSKKRRAARRKQAGGQVPPTGAQTLYLLPGKKFTDIAAAAPGVVTTTPPPATGACAWVAVGGPQAGLTLSRDSLNWDTPPKALATSKGVFFGNSGLAQDGPVPIGTKKWSDMNNSRQIYFGAVDQTNGDHLKTHEFYITGVLSDGTKLSDALTKLATAPSYTMSKLTTGQKSGYSVYKSNNSEYILLSLSNNKGTPNASDVVLQISTYMVDSTGNNICIQWTPPSSSTAAAYVGPILSSNGLANTSIYNVNIARCPGKNGSASAPTPPDSLVAGVMGKM